LNVAVIGLGYVGAVTAGCLAQLGRTVIGVDTDAHKADVIAAGRSPISEPGLDDLIAAGVAADRLRVAGLAEAVAASDVIMVAVGTPSEPSGALDLSAVLRVCEEIGRALPDDGRFRTVVVRSTVLPGSVDQQIRPALEAASGRTAGDGFGLATNPEFLREGSSIRDFFEATRTSELVKYTDNAFHAVKIAFANEISSLARRFEVDGRQVMALMTADDRLNISPVYLRPGYAFGGSCLPKDLRALTDRARKSDLDLPLLSAALPSNAAHFDRGVALVEATGLRRVGILGLSFKSSTDDLRESPAVALAERLLGRGYELSIYDEDVRPDTLRGTNRAFIDAHLPHLGRLLSESLDATLAASELVVITKVWPAIESLPQRLRPDQAVVDLAGVPWPPDQMPERYAGIGW
jgi:GDP-mannose 6-dehydrogenase